MPLSDIESRYLNAMAEQQFPTMPPAVEPAGTVRPGAMEGEMSAIPQTRLEAIMEQTGASLEQIGTALDGLGKVNIFGIDIGIRDLLPFVGGSEEEIDPITGKKTIKQVGTPEALQKAGRGESLVRGTGFATQLVPDAKLAAFDVPAAGTLVKSTARMGTAAVKDIAREMATTPPRGSVQIRPTPVQTPTPVRAPRSKLGFYSAVEETVANLPQAKGTGQQFLAQIGKTAGVKPEEIQWTGLDEFLKGKKSVTKQEVQDYLAANRVDVQEVRLGENFAPGYQFSTYNEWENALDQAEAAGDVAEVSRLNEWAKLRYDTPNQTKFSSYTLPGGENYREILLTLPDTKGARLDARRAEIEAKGRNATDAEKQEWSSIMNQLQPETRDVEGLSPFRNRPEFRSTHFDQPNILAHLRVNDRTVDGKKTLFVEEIQSDWHQAGRKKGYAGENQKALLKNQTRLGEIDKILATAKYTPEEGSKLLYEQGQLAKEYGELEAKRARGGDVPDAPFKTSWHELSLKRAIQEAAEKGYDQIAFTTGKTQVERYPEALRQVADDISWSNIDESGRKYVDIKKDGNIVLQVSVDQSGKIYQSSIQDAYGKTLDEFVGKPMAQRVTSESQGTIKGQDFTVGGKGMEGFYDNILPKSLEKLGKKFDAKVGKTEMDGVEVWQMDITPKMRETVTKQGQPLFQIGVGGGAAAGAATMQDNEERM
jgi:hypothetical protein